MNVIIHWNGIVRQPAFDDDKRKVLFSWPEGFLPRVGGCLFCSLFEPELSPPIKQGQWFNSSAFLSRLLHRQTLIYLPDKIASQPEAELEIISFFFGIRRFDMTLDCAVVEGCSGEKEQVPRKKRNGNNRKRHLEIESGTFFNINWEDTGRWIWMSSHFISPYYPMAMEQFKMMRFVRLFLLPLTLSLCPFFISPQRSVTNPTN